MKLSKDRVEIAMAKACMNPYDLCTQAEMPYQTYQRVVSKEKECKPATVGRIARALKVKVEDLIETN